MNLHELVAIPDEIDIEFVWADHEGVETPEVSDAEWLGYLTADEIERRSSFKSERRRRTFTMGRVAARRLLAKRLGVAPQMVDLVIDESGAVDVLGFDGYLSITHTDHAAAAVIAPGPIGVDMEPDRTRAADLYKYVLHEAQYGLLDNPVMDRNSTVLGCWVVKEAVLKGMRTGLRVSPLDLELAVDFGSGVGSVSVANGSKWSIHYSRVGENHLAIAYQTR